MNAFAMGIPSSNTLMLIVGLAALFWFMYSEHDGFAIRVGGRRWESRLDNPAVSKGWEPVFAELKGEIKNALTDPNSDPTRLREILEQLRQRQRMISGIISLPQFPLGLICYYRELQGLLDENLPVALDLHVVLSSLFRYYPAEDITVAVRVMEIQAALQQNQEPTEQAIHEVQISGRASQMREIARLLFRAGPNSERSWRVTVALLGVIAKNDWNRQTREILASLPEVQRQAVEREVQRLRHWPWATLPPVVLLALLVCSVCNSGVFGTFTFAFSLPLRRKPRVSETGLETTRLLELTKSFELNWSRVEQRLVDRLLGGKLPQRSSTKNSLGVTDRRVDQLITDIRKRLEPLANAIERGALDKENVRTWPVALLKLDEDRDDRRFEKTLLARHITMVSQLLGPNSMLALPESRKGLGKGILGMLEEKLKQYGSVDELAWKLPPPPDSRRTSQEEIERRIQKLNQR